MFLVNHEQFLIAVGSNHGLLKTGFSLDLEPIATEAKTKVGDNAESIDHQVDTDLPSPGKKSR